jgi:hypothetical protein
MLDVTRVEKKFVIDPIGMELMKRRLSNVMISDPHNGPDGYTVRSLYFDSIRDKDYFSKADGLDIRKKIRLRIYSSQDKNAKLEVKEKADGMQRKRSLSITREESEMMLNGEYGFLAEKDDPFALATYYVMTKELYRPKCIVEYDRYAFIHTDNNIRVTFDQNLRMATDPKDMFRPVNNMIPVAGASDITLEVKYDGFLYSSIKSAIGDDLSINISSSKYCRVREHMGF